LTARGLVVACPAALLVALLAGCATIKVNVDYDPQADFSAYRTFALLPDPKTTGNPRADNPLLHGRIKDSIRQQLALQGYVLSESPQMLIGYHVSTEQRLDVRTVDSYYGYADWRYGGPGLMGTTTHVQQYEQGTLVIDVVDAVSNTLVWRGVGAARLRSNPTPEQQTQRVREAVAAILTRFPPGKGGE
jgi:hypothetical protein